jgi:hypothetical protein
MPSAFHFRAVNIEKLREAVDVYPCSKWRERSGTELAAGKL